MDPRERSAKTRSATPPRGVCIRYALAAALVFVVALTPASATGQTGGLVELINGNLQKRVNGVLTLMQ